MHVTASSATPGHPAGARALYQLRCYPCIPVPRAARTLPPQLVSSARSQCTSSHGWSDHAQAVRYPRSGDLLARTVRRLTRALQCAGSFSPDRLAPPSAASWAFFLPCFRHGTYLPQQAQHVHHQTTFLEPAILVGVKDHAAHAHPLTCRRNPQELPSMGATPGVQARDLLPLSDHLFNPPDQVGESCTQPLNALNETCPSGGLSRERIKLDKVGGHQFRGNGHMALIHQFFDETAQKRFIRFFRHASSPFKEVLMREQPFCPSISDHFARLSTSLCIAWAFGCGNNAFLACAREACSKPHSQGQVAPGPWVLSSLASDLFTIFHTAVPPSACASEAIVPQEACGLVASSLYRPPLRAALWLSRSDGCFALR